MRCDGAGERNSAEQTPVGVADADELNGIELVSLDGIEQFAHPGLGACARHARMDVVRC
jgi:hypothetical protein